MTTDIIISPRGWGLGSIATTLPETEEWTGAETGAGFSPISSICFMLNWQHKLIASHAVRTTSVLRVTNCSLCHRFVWTNSPNTYRFGLQIRSIALILFCDAPCDAAENGFVFIICYSDAADMLSAAKRVSGFATRENNFSYTLSIVSSISFSAVLSFKGYILYTVPLRSRVTLNNTAHSRAQCVAEHL